MHGSWRLQYALIGVALLPCWAIAQSGTLGNTTTDAPVVGAAPTSPTVATQAASQPSNLETAVETAAPAAQLETDPIPTAVPAAEVAPDAIGAVGPTASSATSGIRLHAATEDLSRQQLADRATHHGGLGTDGALMIVGGAAFIAGLIIGGGAGTAIAIAGAAIGLYGLYLYLR
jgi:hypothetical protein